MIIHVQKMFVVIMLDYIIQLKTKEILVIKMKQDQMVII